MKTDRGRLGISTLALLGLVGCTGGVTALDWKHRAASSGQRRRPACGAEAPTARRRPDRELGERPVLATPAPRALTARVPGASGEAAAGAERTTNTGWRFGAVYVTGGLAKRLDEGYRAGPLLSLFGYQFDIERGGEGETRTVVQIIPALVGLDTSIPIPTLNVIVGLRLPNGFEFGAGPHWAYREYELQTLYPEDGIHVWGGGFTVGVGYTVTDQSGRLSVPMSLAASLAEDGVMWSLTIGWSMGEW